MKRASVRVALVVLLAALAAALLAGHVGRRGATAARPGDSAASVDPPCFASHLGLPCSS